VGLELFVIRRSLATIASAIGRLGPALDAATRPSGKPTQAGRKRKLSPARRASLKLQGQYMGYLRNLKPGQKVRVKAVRVSRGFRPAIKLARTLAAQ
jgi:hypothetical protein